MINKFRYRKPQVVKDEPKKDTVKEKEKNEKNVSGDFSRQNIHFSTCCSLSLILFRYETYS